jgi:activating signal cointegrator 1
MRAISLWQPWASLWCSDRKVHETRHWPTAHRGWLAVHAAKRFEKDFDGDPLQDILGDEFGPQWGLELPTGAIVGVVKVVACKPTVTLFKNAAANDDDLACGDFSEGRFAWEREEFSVLPQPIPYRGQQGMFSVPNELFPTRFSSCV